MPKGIYKYRLLTEEHKKKISEALKGRISPNKGNRYSEKTKKKLSESHKGYIWTEKSKNN